MARTTRSHASAPGGLPRNRAEEQGWPVPKRVLDLGLDDRIQMSPATNPPEIVIAPGERMTFGRSARVANAILMSPSMAKTWCPMLSRSFPPTGQSKRGNSTPDVAVISSSRLRIRDVYIGKPVRRFCNGILGNSENKGNHRPVNDWKSGGHQSRNVPSSADSRMGVSNRRLYSRSSCPSTSGTRLIPKTTVQPSTPIGAVRKANEIPGR